MKRTRFALLSLVVALLVLPAVSTAQEDAASLAAQGYEPSGSGERGIVWTDRADLEAQVLARWRGVPTRSGHGSDPEELAKAVASVSEVRLIRAAAAQDVDAFVHRLAAHGNGGGYVTNSGGTPIPDLTFVPVAPCRIFDTRLATAGKMAAGETRGFYTNSVASLSAFTGQGGDASGCTQVPFDPPAVLINFTVADPEAQGNARVWAYLGAEPATSTINFRTGINLANGTETPTCYSCGPDINVKVIQPVHVIADILGYFRAKDKTIELNVLGALFDGGSGSGTGMGLVFADNGFNSFRTSVFLPQDFSAQTDVTARFLLSIAETGCAADWSANNPLRVLRAGSGTTNTLTATPSTVDITVPATSGNIFSTTATLSSTDIVAGDLLTLSWYRSTDTCTTSLTLRGAQLIYE